MGIISSFQDLIFKISAVCTQANNFIQIHKQMELERITVVTRDEYAGAQDPIAFVWRGQRFQIAQILDRWYEGRLDSTRMPLRYFKVRCEEGDVFILRYHELFRAWGILIPSHRGKN